MASFFNQEIDRLWVLAWRPYQPRYRVAKSPVHARITLRCHVGKWPHAGIHLVRHPVVLHHLRAVVETAGLALHDEEPERISRLFDETIADFSFGSGRPRACGKCRQRSLKPRTHRCRRRARLDAT